MTPAELRKKLSVIDHNEYLIFLHKFAEKRKEVPKDFVEYFVEHPEDERLLAHLLGLPTEEERNTRAAVSMDITSDQPPMERINPPPTKSSR